ncbi:hypothetical protein PFISCL1PPCAC_8397, partial [Pristionchus fissidentatus]
MTEKSKSKAINKAANIQVNVAFPDFILNDTQLDARYAELIIADTDSFYDMLEKIAIYNINEEYKQLTESTV